MNTGLLVVMNVGAEDAICERFLPYWEKSGCDIDFSSPLDDKSSLGTYFCGYSYNRDKPSTWSNYQKRVLQTMRRCEDTQYEWFCFTQYDSVCFGKLPEPPNDHCVTHIAGFGIEGLGNWFVHPPWIFGRKAMELFISEAETHPIDLCRGVMDFWMAKIIETARIPVIDSSGRVECNTETGTAKLKEIPRKNVWSWSENHIDTPEKLESARRFHRNGGLFIHGVKDGATLDKIIA